MEKQGQRVTGCECPLFNPTPWLVPPQGPFFLIPDYPGQARPAVEHMVGTCASSPSPHSPCCPGAQDNTCWKLAALLAAGPRVPPQNHLPIPWDHRQGVGSVQTRLRLGNHQPLGPQVPTLKCPEQGLLRELLTEGGELHAGAQCRLLGDRMPSFSIAQSSRTWGKSSGNLGRVEGPRWRGSLQVCGEVQEATTHSFPRGSSLYNPSLRLHTP